VRGGKAFAGGLRMGTPMGVIYSTNITPDPETGIGNYSLEDFDRAVRSGIVKDGHHLYPAMPYPSYAKISDEDIQALYTFFMREVSERRLQGVPGPRRRLCRRLRHPQPRSSGQTGEQAERNPVVSQPALAADGLEHDLRALGRL
jgi:hypothetical protein